MRAIARLSVFLLAWLVAAVGALLVPQAALATLAAPVGLSAVAQGSQAVALEWSASSGATGYHVYRGADLVADTTSAQFVDRQLDGGTTYSYQVQAFNTGGEESARSNTATAATATTPAAPANFARCGAATGEPGCGYTSSTPADAGHPDTGGKALTDGVRGQTAYGAPWQGRTGTGSYSFTVDEQELSVACLHVLQAAVAYVNTLLVQDVLAEPAWADALTAEDRRGLTPLFWTHAAPYGQVRLNMSQRLELRTEAAGRGGVS